MLDCSFRPATPDLVDPLRPRVGVPVSGVFWWVDSRTDNLNPAAFLWRLETVLVCSFALETGNGTFIIWYVMETSQLATPPQSPANVRGGCRSIR